jgi:pilus assembly protein Flp/PilA
VSAIRQIFRRLIADRRGATAIEYGLIVALIGIAMSSALSLLGGGNGGMWTKIAGQVSSVTTAANS